MVNGGDLIVSVKMVNPSVIRKLGLKALAESLGPVGMVRFLQQYEAGEGDYTKEREQWLHGLTVKEIVKEVKSQRKKK